MIESCKVNYKSQASLFTLFSIMDSKKEKKNKN